jgi:hypothetical protein
MEKNGAKRRKMVFAGWNECGMLWIKLGAFSISKKKERLV